MRWEIRLIDRDRRALAIAQDAIAQVATGWGRNARVTTERGDVTAAQFAAESADLVVAGGLLNELDAAAARELVRRAVSALAPGGAAILIEPALRETTRALHHLRDWVIDEGIAHVFAPCTRRLAPCPALADDRDWCHEDRPTNLPERAARLAAATGLRTHGLKFAYLVLRADEAPRLAEDGALRVVSQPSKQKGRRELFACGDDGRLRLRLLRKNRGPDNRAFERARRGDVLVVDGATEASPAATVTDIAASTRVDARSPA
jgi:ribosomal protein RSM22 (predicted rRNA methylase)